MKKIILSLIVVVLCSFAFASGAYAQTAQSTTTAPAKDEFWGTKKVQDPGTSAESVGARGASVDKRLNTYEGKRGNFAQTKFNLKKMKDIEKKEKAMMKKYKRDKKRREKSLK